MICVPCAMAADAGIPHDGCTDQVRTARTAPPGAAHGNAGRWCDCQHAPSMPDGAANQIRRCQAYIASTYGTFVWPGYDQRHQQMLR